MPTLLERYGTLFQEYFTGHRIEPFFLDPSLLPGPKSEIRRQLISRIGQQPSDVRQASAPLMHFLAHFIDGYSNYQRRLPGVFAELSVMIKNGTVLNLLAGNGPMDQHTLSIVVIFGEVMQNYSSAITILNRDLHSLGVRIDS
jgi:hypothetical protein